MATVTLRAPLKERAGTSMLEVKGATVREALASLETDIPAIKGWVLDEQGQIRRHVNVFLNGEPATPDVEVADQDRIDIIHAISGGSND